MFLNVSVLLPRNFIDRLSELTAGLVGPPGPPGRGRIGRSGKSGPRGPIGAIFKILRMCGFTFYVCFFYLFLHVFTLVKRLTF